ncbi:hypothetical protein H5407_13045 [Mitsuaria sp. WAJ17]|uniref:esterase/lipase family protein n=1 Tax=Mitsuaria sp. WAJ17 TaxID=2761452 RepID=UPI00160447B0|nr:hypothetical protein [Mitsuaria sp. WAJ17]MBB2486143.1 hypothetical protein [Mitsuaria sp. WAJ17]
MATHIAFIDGVGGKRFMRGRLIRYFQSRGLQVHCFDYVPSRQSVDEIRARLRDFLRQVAAQGEFHAIGYSFGGVLLRLALTDLGAEGIQPVKVALLASPLTAMRLSQRLRHWRLYRWMAGECGQFAAQQALMAQVPLPDVPTACVYGTWPWLGVFGCFFGRGLGNDGMVAVDEARAPQHGHLPAFPVAASHAFIPANVQALAALHGWFQGPAA